MAYDVFSHGYILAMRMFKHSRGRDLVIGAELCFVDGTRELVDWESKEVRAYYFNAICSNTGVFDERAFVEISPSTKKAISNAWPMAKAECKKRFELYVDSKLKPKLIASLKEAVDKQHEEQRKKEEKMNAEEQFIQNTFKGA